jgi:hypothetical protein
MKCRVSRFLKSASESRQAPDSSRVHVARRVRNSCHRLQRVHLGQGLHHEQRRDCNQRGNARVKAVPIEPD